MLFFSVSLLDKKETFSEESLQASVQCLREKLQAKEQLIISLKSTLDTERSEGCKLREKVQKLFLSEELVSLQLCALTISKKGKRGGFINFKRKKSENETVKSVSSGVLNEKQVSIVIQLVQAKQQLENEIKESLEMDTRLSSLAKHGEEYTEMLHKKCMDFGDGFDKTTSDSFKTAGINDNSEVAAKLLKEKHRLDNEVVFKEAHEGLLEKQIALLKKQKKCCINVLRKYDEVLDGHSGQSIVPSLVNILTTSVCNLDDDPRDKDTKLETKVEDKSKVSKIKLAGDPKRENVSITEGKYVF